MFLKIDIDEARTDVEAEAMAMAPVPTPEILWRRPPLLALAALPGRALGVAFRSRRQRRPLAGALGSRRPDLSHADPALSSVGLRLDGETDAFTPLGFRRTALPSGL